jgi:hypothetical protein
MKEAGNGAENFSLGAFAGAWGTENENGGVAGELVGAAHFGKAMV